MSYLINLSIIKKFHHQTDTNNIQCWSDQLISHDFTWFHKNSCKIIWTLKMNSYDFTWNHLKSYDFTWNMKFQFFGQFHRKFVFFWKLKKKNFVQKINFIWIHLLDYLNSCEFRWIHIKFKYKFKKLKKNRLDVIFMKIQ